MTLFRLAVPNRFRRWLYYLLLWLVTGTLSAVHWELFFGPGNPYQWWELFRIKVALWYTWGLFTPFILWIGWKFQLGRTRFAARLALLLPISLIVTLAYLIVYSELLWLNSLTVPSLRSSTFATMLDFSMSNHSTWYFLAFWALIGVENAAIYYRRYHERELIASQLETQLAAAHLAALRNQLQPHFLFNTLHSILALVRQHDDENAVRMLTSLSDLLRHVLDHVQHQTVPLRDEVDLLRRYIAIEQIRFSDRLTVTWAIDATTLDAAVPSFVLQPLAENAIRHGIENCPGPGRIDVATRRDNGALCLDVSDNGIGIRPTDTSASANGHGLGDMRARLDILYPGRYSLGIDSSAASGTTVRLRIPWSVHSPVTQPNGTSHE